MDDYPFQLEMAVRDYECDIQGIVNNAVYQNYLEHARHEYLRSVGVNFADLAQQGINLVVVRIEIDFKKSLQSGDRFVVGVKVARESRIRFAFNQTIHRMDDDQKMISAKVIGTSVGPNGRPIMPDVLLKLFQE